MIPDENMIHNLYTSVSRNQLIHYLATVVKTVLCEQSSEYYSILNISVDAYILYPAFLNIFLDNYVRLHDIVVKIARLFYIFLKTKPKEKRSKSQMKFT